MKKKKVKEIGITALYERLSRDDDGDGDSNSIVHQKQMLETYAKEQKIKFIKGERSFDDWDNYITEINKMGDIEAALEIYNSKLD